LVLVLFTRAKHELTPISVFVLKYDKQIEQALEVQRRSLDLLDRQENLLRRAELLMERLEKNSSSG
jgi:hypothetical protein